jgi:fermentation-respiration switch protein FrsA (DUF1100 family)
MSLWQNRKYSKIDRLEINNVLFYPRRDPICTIANRYAKSIMIPVGAGEMISTLWSEADNVRGSILFFHGNGEIASDYLDIAGIFLQTGIRFICADYRGYGHSSGKPSITSMLDDAHDIFHYVRERLTGKGEPLIIMGRSLGSASALELAAACEDLIDGLIIESGFAQTMPLLRILGANPDDLQISEEDGLANIEKIKKYSKPLLIIHAADDLLIPADQAEKLYVACGATQKKMLLIPDAGHNDIFFAGMKLYVDAVNELMTTVVK